MTYKEALAEAARKYLQECLEKTQGNMASAARIAGVHRGNFYLMCRRHGVDYTTARTVKPHKVPDTFKAWSQVCLP